MICYKNTQNTTRCKKKASWKTNVHKSMSSGCCHKPLVIIPKDGPHEKWSYTDFFIIFTNKKLPLKEQGLISTK